MLKKNQNPLQLKKKGVKLEERRDCGAEVCVASVVFAPNCSNDITLCYNDQDIQLRIRTEPTHKRSQHNPSITFAPIHLHLLNSSFLKLASHYYGSHFQPLFHSGLGSPGRSDSCVGVQGG